MHCVTHKSKIKKDAKVTIACNDIDFFYSSKTNPATLILPVHLFQEENLKIVGQNWYQSIQYDKLSGRQVFFTLPQWTPSREEHKLFSVFSTF